MCADLAPPAEGPQLVFGLAGAVGTDLNLVSKTLQASLEGVAYRTYEVGLSGLLDVLDWGSHENPPAIDDSTIDLHIETRMEAGDRLREALGRGDAMALLAISKIALEMRDDETVPEPRSAYILRSLKHPQEVAALRKVYAENFFLISAYAPSDGRADRLTRQIGSEWERVGTSSEGRSAKGKAWDLIERDRLEANRLFGQKLGATFPMADFFVDARRQQDLEAQIERLVELLFQHPFHTPTRDESAMFHAQAAALRSSAPGRQVGAAITTPEGDLVAAGTNEVPKPGGGQYWTEDDPDERDFRRADPDVSGTEKRVVVEQILTRLVERDWLNDERSDATAKEFYDLLDGLRVQSLIEFERVVHAEMAAIVDAARRGVAVRAGYLYSTTFPCHECTRHLIAAGINRVVYVEPYPKSLASHLHDDAIAIDEDNPPAHKVRFEPFVGVAPRQFLALFTAGPESRRDPAGMSAPARAGWMPKGVPVPSPRLAEEPTATPLAPDQAKENQGVEPKNEEETPERTFGSPSDVPFIMREKSMLFELNEALEHAGLQVKE
jgi:deoxycytidylate deaminase